jgi:hypothetical protein
VESNHIVEVNSGTFRWIMDYIKKEIERDHQKNENVNTEFSDTQVIRGRLQAMKQLSMELTKFLPK